MCQDCADRLAVFCEHCEEMVLRDNATDVGGRNSIIWVCDSCCNGNYDCCESCGAWFNYRESGCNGRCDDCCEEPARYVEDYSYKPYPNFYQKQDVDEIPDLYLGIELEVDEGYSRHDASDDIHDLDARRVYMKEDGSLSDSGFEIVSHPCTLAYHKEDMEWGKIMEICRDYDYCERASSCGLHIHASRAFFGESRAERDLHIAKVVMLISRFWTTHIIPFSRRRLDALFQWAGKGFDLKVTKDDSESDISLKLTAKSNEGRYVAVNLRNANTIEFRFFKGTLDLDTLHAAMEFVDAICRFAKRINIEDVDTCSWTDICEGDYPALHEYNLKLGLE